MAESEYPSILDTEEFRGKTLITEEFSVHHNSQKRYFGGFLAFNLKNLGFQCILNVKLNKLIKSLCYL